MSSNTISRPASIVLITAVLTLLVGAWIGSARASPQGASAQVPPATPQEEAAIARAEDLSLAFQRASKVIAPSVVNITAVERVARRRFDPNRPRPDRGSFEDFLEDWLENRFGDRPEDPQNPQDPPGDEDDTEESQEPDGPDEPDDRSFRPRFGQGSGVIVRQDGYILTNHHIVGEADEIRVTLEGGRRYEAHIIDSDIETDLAVIKIDESGLIAAQFADSDAIQVGQWVMAVGNPFGLDHSVTAGIISAKGRPSLLDPRDFGNLIQTDAAINPGNSGGPLINLRGEILGINQLISTNTGTNLGIGFAIPSNMANSVVQSVLRTGNIVRGYLGVTYRQLTADLAHTFGYRGSTGMFVSSVVKDGPAEAAGLHRGDIVLELNGRPMHNSNEFRNSIARSIPGTTVHLNVFRLGDERRVALTLGKRPLREELNSQRYRGPATQRYRAGFIGEEITPDLAEALELRSDDGVFVILVIPGSRADDAGFHDGDVILSIGGEPIQSLDSLSDALSASESGTGVQIHRAGRTRMLTLE